MDYDESKIDEAVLALLGALEFQNGRVWKRIEAFNRDRPCTESFLAYGRYSRADCTLTGSVA